MKCPRLTYPETLGQWLSSWGYWFGTSHCRRQSQAKLNGNEIDQYKTWRNDKEAMDENCDLRSFSGNYTFSLLGHSKLKTAHSPGLQGWNFHQSEY